VAYKEESYEQFLETLSAQLSMRKLNSLGPNPQNIYHGNDHPDQDDEDRIHPNNQAHFVRSLSDRNARWDETPDDDEEYTQSPVDMSMARTPTRNVPDPVMKNMRFKGGYSTDAGRFPQNKKTAPISSVGLEPRIEMRNVKREIEETEKKLHELQQQKVKLMRQLTGRL